MGNRHEAGWTVIEALIALFILSVAGAALVAGTGGGLIAVAAAQRSARAATTVLRLDDTLRRAARRVRIPYWERSAEILVEEASAAVPWLDGTPEETLRVSVRDDGIDIEAGSEKYSFSGLSDAALAEVPGGNGETRGIELKYEIGGKTFRTAAPFGATALGEEKP